MAYIYVENDEIMMYSEDWFPGATVSTRKVVRGYDGKLYFAEEAKSTTLEEAKNRAYELLKNYRQTVEANGIIIDDKHWGSNFKDELRLANALQFLETNPEETLEWKIENGVYLQLTLEKAKQISAELVAHYNKCYKIESLKRDEISALGSVEEVSNWLSTNLTTGWFN